MGKDSWRQSMESLPKKASVQKQFIAGKHSPCQARYVWVAGSIPDFAQIKTKQTLASVCFYSGGRI
jgi:hypothetical protein